MRWRRTPLGASGRGCESAHGRGGNVIADLRLHLLVPARREAFPIVEAAIAGGVTVVQLREKTLPDGETYRIGQELRALVHRSGALFFVNDRADLALALAADGVHIGHGDLPLDAVRAVVGQRLFVGVSSHSLAQAQALGGTDYIAFGPVFATSSKADAEAPKGVAALRSVVAAVSRPLVAIGGIDRENAPALRDSGIAGVAAISAILGADDPQAAAAALRKGIGL